MTAGFSTAEAITDRLSISSLVFRGYRPSRSPPSKS